MLLIRVLPVMLANSIKDLLFKSIFLWLTVAWGVLGLGMRIYQGCDFDCGFLIGAIILVIAILTKGKIGYGDGILVLALSMHLKVWQLVEVLVIAELAAGVVSLLLLGFWHKKKDYEIPFVPFVFLGTLVVSIGDLL